ncbi:MAG: cupin [Spirochaetes bacterium]|nr:MAG: cupin [Spirochaetota bacterium]
MEKIKIEKLSEEEIERRGIKNWGIWEKEVSEFDWEYTSEEHCYIIEGKVKVETPEGDVEINKGDYVVFPVGLKCKWKVLEPVKKYYNFK